MTLRTRWRLRLGCSALLLAATVPVSARADFFDGARQTFQNDIPHFFQTDVPHFFQDDIPCAFGGQPTSHTKTSCNAPSRPARPVATSPEEAREIQDAPPSPIATPNRPSDQ
ncbi:MAG TPA: hypothetical protein VM689_10790 [Aliidongia sp.]|nr:hypothetical protein [Aliidongia sp.]